MGQHIRGFPRLVKGIDDIAGQIQEEVVMQIGSTDYIPRNGRWFRFTDYEEMKQLNSQARVVITHAGAGSIITALKAGAAIILVPRLSQYGEALDDHQLQLANAMSANGRAKVVHDVRELGNALQNVIKPEQTNSSRKRLVKALREHLENLARGRRHVADTTSPNNH